MGSELADEERRLITVIFADLAGFTSDTERSDPEDVHSRLTVYHRRAREDIERFGGRVEKLMGDGVFGVFGVPVAHEDDPERAVRAALRIQESVIELNRDTPWLGLAVRIAVTTGEALVQIEATQDREGIVGDVVNVAARLEAMAPVGGIVVDERTYLASRGAIEHRELDAVTLKGKSAPVRIWQVVEARSRYGVAVEDHEESAFIGREQELGILKEAFRRTVERRRPHLVTISGEPGVGKSRLVRELRQVVDDLPDLVFWRQGRCLPYGEGVTFWAFGEIIRAHAGILESEPAPVAAEKLRRAVDEVIGDSLEADWVRLRLSALIGAEVEGDPAERQELFTAWRKFFESLSERSPLVLVIEDLHWADEVVLEFIEHLLDWSQDAPILVVATTRPELFTEHSDWGGGKRDAATLSLGPLSDGETSQLLLALAEKVVMAADAHQFLIERSGGNPLYVTEFVRLATERGSAAGADLAIPDSIHGVIAARLDLLDQEDKSLLQAASVVGRVFWAAAVSFARNRDGATVGKAMKRLAVRELIRPVRRPSMQGQDEYSFVHALVREVVYGQITRSDRARLHLEVARWVEAVSADRLSEVAELLAHHHSMALELEPTEDPDRLSAVYRHLMLAGERARSLDAERGASFFRKAVGVARLALERARALYEYGFTTQEDIELAREALSEAITLFREEQDRENEAMALSALANLEWWQGNGDLSDELNRRAVEAVDGLSASVAVAETLVSHAANLQLGGHEVEGIEFAERALSMSQMLGSTPTYARALLIRASCLAQMGDFGVEEELRDAVRISLDRNLSQKAVSAYNNLATILGEFGRLEDARREIEAAIDYAAQRGLGGGLDWSLMTLCEFLVPLGEWDRVIEIADRVMESDAARGGSQSGAFAAGHKATVLFYRGQLREAQRLIRIYLAKGREIHDPQVLVPGLAAALAIAHAGGEPDVGALASEFQAVSADHPVFLAFNLWVVARPLVQSGAGDILSELVGRAKAGSPWTAAKVKLARAALYESRGDLEAAFADLEEVIAVGDPLSQVLGTTVARLAAARCGFSIGYEESAGRYLDEAKTAARRLGARRLLDEAATLGDSATSGRTPA